MPITITPTQPAGVFTPGGSVFVSSDFIGPLEQGASFVFLWYSEPEEQRLIWQSSLPTTVTATNYRLFQDVQGTPGFGVALPAEGASTALRVRLQEPTSGIVDTGVQIAPFSPTIGLSSQIILEKGTTGGGLTSEQALQLSQTHVATFTDQLLDLVTLVSLTTGPSQGPINAALPSFFWGVIVRLATIPPELEPTTPDLAYWVKTLATVRIFRGSDLWRRIPIHTPSKMIPFGSDELVFAVSELFSLSWGQGVTMQVDFLQGVTGEVFLMKLP